MSTLHSATPTTDQPSHPVGFNSQTYYDPFFSSNDSEEDLVLLGSDRSPSHHSFRSSSPPKIVESNGGRPPTATGRAQHTQSALSNGYTSPRPHIENNAGDVEYGFLSPNPYLSDNGYNASSEHTATPDYNGFYLEGDFGMLDNNNQDHSLEDLASFDQNSLHQTSTDIENTHSSHSHRTSVGTATLSSSHLMSPVLTDDLGTSTRDGTASPINKNEEMVAGPHHLVQVNPVYQANPIVGQMLRTPTDSSKGTSPDVPQTMPNITTAASPVIRVEKYVRGDSPARLPDHSNGAKRGRAGSRSSLLAVQDYDSSSKEADDAERFIQRAPLDPDARYQLSSVAVPNLQDQEDSAQRALRNADVEDWLDRSASGSEAGPESVPEKPRQLGRNRRARSVGAQALSHANLETHKMAPADSHIPGPGVLIDESSGEEESQDEEETASIEDSPIATPTKGMNDIPGEAKPGVYDELPNQPPLFRAKLWQDQLYDSSDPGLKMQPVTSNDAIMRFQQRAGDIETLSRVATWGTRRLSESDMQSLFSRFTFNSEEGMDPDRPKRERRGSFLQQAAAKLVPRRSSTFKRKDSEKSKQNNATGPELGDHSRTSSGEIRNDSGLTVPQAAPKGLQRMGSLGKRPKSPRINTGSAVATMAGQMAALGSSGPLSATATSPPPGAWNAAKNVIRRSRSRSDLNSSLPAYTGATDQGLAGLWTKQGGPPMPSFAAPNSDEIAQPGGFDEDDEEDAVDDHGVAMDLSIRPDSIVPTLEGFKANIRQLNPRLPPFMFDRIAQEQLRRFKKLMDFKIKHTQVVNARKCSSGKHCTELGGEPTYLPSKSTRDPETSNTGFSVSGVVPSDDDVNALAEGIVTPAQFPPGVPLPPVKRLPAEFECSLCFKVKRFQKPSDWSKHVHEDVQPFTCTFGTCADPKSFKRKADWVRHENERHRQLEWWQCNMNDCNHKCYRKDNFVQHLVREHKLPEPKIKTAKAGKPAVRGPSSQKARSSKHSENGDESHDEIDQVWKLVEECRFETIKNPKDEACKFCGNVCNSWKKLTVHLAKHMEQISMPVLGVVKQKEVTSDTIISPIEQRINSQAPSMSPISQPGANLPYNVSDVGTSDVPGGFISLPSQPGYFNSTSEPPYQRIPSNTYPPPVNQQQQAAAYAQSRGSPHLISNYNQYNNVSSNLHFNPTNGQQAFSAQTSSPEEIYGGMRAPTSQPRSSPYDDHHGFQYVSQPQQQAFSPAEASVYQFGGVTPSSYPQQHTTPPTSYPQQSQMSTPSPTFPQPSQMGGPVGMGLSMGPMQGFVGNGGTHHVYGQSGQAAFAYQQ
ncbi:MAG: hypothetical protein Q9164_002138 [Protoblastenia rupestris]